MRTLTFIFLFFCTAFTTNLMAQCNTAAFTQITSISASLSNSNYFITADIDINNNITLTDAEFLMAANIKITVRNGATLTIAGCHFYGCTEMWKGILLETGGKLIVTEGATHDNSLIEDADKAIQL